MNRMMVVVQTLVCLLAIMRTECSAGTPASVPIGERILQAVDLVIDGQIGTVQGFSDDLVSAELAVGEVLYGASHMKKVRLVWVKAPVRSNPRP